MGKPYERELDQLDDTYGWAIQAPVSELAGAVGEWGGLPLVGIGSGGSLTAADFACTLHQSYTGLPAARMTPLECVSSLSVARMTAVLVLSAGGANPDVVDCGEFVAVREPRRCLFICLRKKSALSRVARKYSSVDLFEFEPPTVKDGFLATNSLLAFWVLLTRAYAEAYSRANPLPSKLADLLPGGATVKDFVESLRARSSALWSRDTLFALYGPSVRSAAIDLESKFTEGALGNVRIADFRNFAHGMHNWMTRRGQETALLVLASRVEKALAEKTLKLLPHGVPRLVIISEEVGPAAATGCLVGVLALVALAARARGTDPGRPRVAEFGRRLYRLRWLRSSSAYRMHPSPQSLAVARKVRSLPSFNASDAAVKHWEEGWDRTVDKLRRTVFRALVLDYDGTLCDRHDRYAGIRSFMSQELARLVRGGVVVGIATGRGRSVKSDLRRCMDEALWNKIAIAYYNGAHTGLLADDSEPPAAAPPSKNLAAVADNIARDPVLSAFSTTEIRSHQVSIRPNSPAFSEALLALVQLAAEQVPGTRVVASSHSLDVLECPTSKRQIITYVRGLLNDGSASVLAVGDRGAPPGNDYCLLKDETGLSVDEVSCDPQACWNLAPRGYRGVQATRAYLRSLILEDVGFRIDFDRLYDSPSANK